MEYKLTNGKTIRIPEKDIEKSMKILGINRKDAVQLWLEDNDYLVNEEVEALTEKAKINKVSREAKAEKPKVDKAPVKRERKPDEEKENIINILTETLKNHGISAEIVNKSKIIEFTIGDNHYKLDLIKQRATKK